MMELRPRRDRCRPVAVVRRLLPMLGTQQGGRRMEPAAFAVAAAFAAATGAATGLSVGRR